MYSIPYGSYPKTKKMMVTSSAQRLLHGGELRQPYLDSLEAIGWWGCGAEVQWFFLGQDFGVVYLI